MNNFHEYYNEIGDVKFGFTSWHEPESEKLIKMIVRAFQPKLIIDLGTSHGAKVAMFHDAISSAEIHSFDIVDRISEKQKMEIFGDNVHFYLEDVVGYDENEYVPEKFCFYKIKKENLKANENVVSLLNRKDKKLLYIDLGGATAGFLLYYKYLNRGDLLGIYCWEFDVDYVFKELELFVPYHQDLFEGFLTKFWIRR